MKELELQKRKSTLMTAEKTVSSGTNWKRQLDFKDVLLRKNTLSTSSPTHKSISMSIGIFLLMRPKSFVENKGLRTEGVH